MGVAVSPAPGKGRGLFTTAAVAAGQVIATYPVNRFPRQSVAADLFPYVFVDPDRSQDILLVWGLATLVNHDDIPNCRMVWEKRADGEWGALVALKDVPAGEELLLRYTNIQDYDFGGVK